MNLCLIVSPYDSGRYGARMGAGPLKFVSAGIEEALRGDGHTVSTVWLRSDLAFNGEAAAAFAIHRLGAEAAHQAVSGGALPLLLSGNCNASLGMVIGAAADGLIWFDTHGDFNTPDTSPSGFFDGMGMAVLAGICYRAAAASVPGFRPMPASHMAHVGGRDFDPGELDTMRQSGAAVIPAERVRGGDFAWLKELPAQRVHLHFDFDVLDPSVAVANGFPAVPGGLTLPEVSAAFSAIRRQKTLVSASFASYDPAVDSGDRMLKAGMSIIRALVAD